MKKVTTLFSAFILTLIGFSSIYAQEALIISEYIEGSSNNKAIELFNTTDSTINLSDFRLLRSNNGAAEWQDTLKLSGMLSSGDVYVIGNDQAVQEILEESDTTHSITFYNGDDALGLQKDDNGTWTLIDVIGVQGVDPGSAWDVAGVTGATNEQTLVRKSSVVTGTTDWTASAGTNADDSQWIVYDQNDFTNIGRHNAVKVTFIVNTSTLPDTLSEGHFIQLRGAMNGNGGEYLGQAIDWNAGSDLVAENIGGDYWEVDVNMAAGDTLIYKVWSGFDSANGTNNGDGGWEVISSNRTFGAPGSDTTVVIYSDSETAPYVSAEDSVTLFFRVNMGAFVQDNSFNPETDKVGLRGSPNVFQNPDDWGSSVIYLEKEDGPESNNVFYSGVVRVDQAAADTLGEVFYKFVGETAGGDIWDSTPGTDNRVLDIPASDSTIHWVFMQDKAPTSAEIVTSNITFEVNVGILEALGYFDSGIGDKVVVRGEAPLDWGTVEGNTASFDDEDVVWRLTKEFTKAVGSEFKYKYFIEYDTSRTNENSENYIEAIAENVDFGYEEPVTTGGSDRWFEFGNSTTQSTGVEYFNDVNIGALIESENTPTGSVAVTFKIDMTPALSHEVPFRPDMDSLYFQIESKYTALTNDFRSGGGYFTDMVENGTPADIEFLRFTPVEGETNVYSLTLDLQMPTLNDFGYVVRYGQPFTEFESMVVNGEGFSAGRRYYQFIEPTSVEYLGSDAFLGEVYVSQWPTTYEMSTVTWAPSNLEFDTQPDYAALSTSTEKNHTVNGFALAQNYPNPFNPTTNISFTIPTASDVKLTVYNLLGQEVARLVNGRLTAGAHTVKFNASNLASGMYLYRIEAGTFTQNKKMMLIK